MRQGHPSTTAPEAADISARRQWHVDIQVFQTASSVLYNMLNQVVRRIDFMSIPTSISLCASFCSDSVDGFRQELDASEAMTGISAYIRAKSESRLVQWTRSWITAQTDHDRNKPLTSPR